MPAESLRNTFAAVPPALAEATSGTARPVHKVRFLLPAARIDREFERDYELLIAMHTVTAGRQPDG